MSEPEAKSDERGRNADGPGEIPARGWRDIFMRLFRSIGEDRVMLIAGGVTFYLLLALFPALAVFVSLYGLIADPMTVSAHVSLLDMVVPREGLDMIRERLESLAGQESGALGIGMAIGLLIAFWSANNGIKALIEALNIAYREKEKRSFLRLNLVAFAFTLGVIFSAIVLIALLGILPAFLALFPVGSGLSTLLGLLRWPLLLMLFAGGLSLLYRFAPSREPAKWRWITWGSGLATIVWIVASAGFSFYLRNFANYEATYGSLGAVAGFLMWTWISVILLILHARMNAEMELQTRRDSTTGAAEPPGRRGAVVADTLGASP